MESKIWKKIDTSAWKFSGSGDQIEGVLTGREERDSASNLSAKYHLKTDKGTFLVWGSAILDDRMQQVKDGDEVRITYKGQDKNRSGQKINLFDVEVAVEEQPVVETVEESKGDIDAEAH